MASSATMKENVESPLTIICKQKLYEHWQKNAPKIMFGEHQLSIELNEPGDFFLQKAKEELRETPEVVAESIKELRELLEGEPDLHIPDMEDFYITFLRPCKWYAKSAFSLKESLPNWPRLRPKPKIIQLILGHSAFNTEFDNDNELFKHFTQQIKRYYRFRQSYPHIYKDLSLTKDKVALCAGLIYPLPVRTKEGCRVLIVEGGKRWKPKEVPLNDFFKGLLSILFLAMVEYRTQIAGAHIILDVEGLSLSHLTYLTPSFAKMLVDFIQKCLPTRLKGIHIVNQSFIFNMAFAIFKPFLEEKIRKRIHFHGTNWESLISFIDKGALLKRHGGEIKMPEGQYGEMLWQNMLSCEPAFDADQHYGYITDKDKI